MNNPQQTQPIRPGNYEFEAEPGLPEVLPDGEQILWQGRPAWFSLSRSVFRTHWIASYFGAVLVWRLATDLFGGASAGEMATTVTWLLMPAVSAIGLLCFLAWLNSRAAIYTITNHRVVIRLGVALQMTVNLPFARVLSADFSSHPDGTGDLVLSVTGAEQLGYTMMWPHVRPWRFGADFQPSLRCIPDAGRVAEILATALSASEQGRVQLARSADQQISAGSGAIRFPAHTTQLQEEERLAG